MHRSIPIALLAASLLTACSTELDINEPYKDITIVYGLLNQKDSVHFVKINKAFLGEGNALDMALVRDSSEYSGEAISYAKVFRVNSSGTVLDSFPLLDTIVVNREPGTFYSPVQKLKYFVTPFTQTFPPSPNPLGIRMFLWHDDQYQIRLKINDITVSSTTAIANDFPISQFNVNTPTTNVPVNFRNTSGTDYRDYLFEWDSRPDCKRFEVSYRFNFDEVTGTDTVTKTITRRIGTKVASSNGQTLAVSIPGESFYSTIGSSIKAQPNWQNVNKRIFRGMDFLVSVANDDFHNYLTLTEPVTGIVNDRPQYSNLENGIGIWGSRYTKNVIGKRLNTHSFEELKNGPYTVGLHFCSPQDGFECP